MYVYIYLYGEATPIILTLNHSMFVQMQRIWGKQKCTSTTLLIQNDFKWQLYQLFFTEILCFFVITQDVTVLYFTYHNSEFHIQWQQLHLSCTKELNLSPPGNSRIYRNTGYVYSGGALAVLHDAHNCESTQTDSGSCTQHSLRSDLHQKSSGGLEMRLSLINGCKILWEELHRVFTARIMIRMEVHVGLDRIY